MSFNHEDLLVYKKALSFLKAIRPITRRWHSRYAVKDQLLRAGESVLMNIAEASSFRSSDQKRQALGYAYGSTLECAGCIDVSQIHGLLDVSQANSTKETLAEISRMLFGLNNPGRRSRSMKTKMPMARQS